MSTDEESASLHVAMRKAIQQFELDQHHEKIYDDPNELIKAGFPADFLLLLIAVYKSSEKYRYFRRGKLVDEMIGISHLALVYAIADYVGVPEGTGSGFTGRGFAMRATIDAINSIMTEGSKPS